MSKSARSIRLAAVAVCGMFAVTAAGCSSPAPAPAPAAPSASSSASAPASSASPSSPSAAASASGPASAAPTPAPTKHAITVGDLRDALLRVDEVGSGLLLDTRPGSPPADFFRSTDGGCRNLVAILNRSDRQSKAKGVARATYVDENGPTTFVESIELYGSKAKAGKAVETFRQATTTCKRLTVKFTKVTSATATVTAHQLPGLGNDNAVAQVVLTSGSLKDFSFVFSTTQINAVELRSFSAALKLPAASAKITKAVTKATGVLS